jgi:type IV pilus assembly protein PilB
MSDLPVIRDLELLADEEAIRLVPRRVAERLVALPMRMEGDRLLVAMASPQDLYAVDELARVIGRKVQPAQAGASAIQKAILRFYGDAEELETGPALVEPGLTVEADARVGGAPVTGEEAPAVEFVNSLLETAIASRASDIHIEPQATGVYVRLRVDGVLLDQTRVPVDMHPGIVSRIKILAGMDIAEPRLPQDGRFDGRLRGQVFDIRVSSVPSIFGQNVVLRLLPKTASGLRLSELGFLPDQLSLMSQLVARPFGMVIATGPTGSGKTTTLYGVLSRLDRVGKHVLTIEDPVEYQLPRVTQIQVNPKVGLDFAHGLRSILRQDPDILMVGEIRDVETLRMAIQSALTGHLVLTTVHCNDAASGAARLIDMGAEPFLVASAVSAMISQRLVRKICERCKTEDTPPAEVLEGLGLAGQGPFYRGKGCEHCRGTGYHGMTGVFETLVVDEVIGGAINRRETASEIRRLAKSLGVRDLLDDAKEKVLLGITTVEEITRAVFVEQ